MKKILVVSILSAVCFISCGGKKTKTSDQIVISDLKTPCECVDAMGVVVDEMVAATDKCKTRKELYADKDALEKLNNLRQKLKEIDRHCIQVLKIPKEEAEKCSGFYKTDAKHDKLEEIM